MQENYPGEIICSKYANVLATGLKFLNQDAGIIFILEKRNQTSSTDDTKLASESQTSGASLYPEHSLFTPRVKRLKGSFGWKENKHDGTKTGM